MDKRGGISFIEFCMIIATLAVVALFAVPSYRNADEAIAVERTARILDGLNASWRSGDLATSVTNAPWPDAVMRETWTVDSTNGVTISVSLRSGERRISAKDSSGYR